MKILIACECSGEINKAFTDKGHDALSCDLQPCEILGLNHYQGDIIDILYSKHWDRIIAHPECKYLCNSGVWALKYPEKFPRRMEEVKKAHDFFMMFYTHPCKQICIENSIPHKYAQLPPYTQTIQPWQFGEDASKRTCLWLKGLPSLKPTNIIIKKHYSNQTKSGQNKLAPGINRSKERAKTYRGIAEAMANQWV